MHPVVDRICRKHFILPEELFGSHPQFVAARKEAIHELFRAGVKPQQIALEVRCHLQTVYYWLRPKRRIVMIEKSKLAFKIGRLNGPKQTKKQRDEILAAYLADPAKGTALAVSKGLAPLYAYKLAHAMGAIPKTRQHDKHL